MKHITTDELRRMTNTEGLILQGCGGDPQEWLNGVNELLTQEGVLLEGAVFKDACVFEHEGLTNLLFSMEEVKLDIGKLAMWRIASHDTFGGTWLSDYLHNRLGVDLDAPPPEPSSSLPEPEHEPQTQEKTAVLQAYIENADAGAIGVFTVPLPITAEKLRPWLEAIEADESGGNVVVWDIRSELPGLQEALSGMNEGLNLEELNYLAVKISALSVADRELFSASLDSDRHCGNVVELISLTGNLDRFDLQPAFTPEQYGEFLMDMVKDDTAAALSKLERSEDDDARRRGSLPCAGGAGGAGAQDTVDRSGGACLQLYLGQRRHRLCRAGGPAHGAKIRGRATPDAFARFHAAGRAAGALGRYRGPVAVPVHRNPCGYRDFCFGCALFSLSAAQAGIRR